MSKRNFYFLLLAGTVLSLPAWALSSPSRTGTHTHTRVSELKPASQFAEPDKAYKTASICFLGVGDCDPNVGFKDGDDYTVNTEKQCLNEGFSRLNCNAVQQGYGICPYNSAYGKGCKCRTNLVSCPAGQVGVGEACGGKYASCGCSPSLVSCPSNKNGTGASCGGKYQGCSCKSVYVYTSSNCSYPRSLSGSSCDGRYTGCSCPSGVSSGTYGCAEYYPSPCSGICKRAKSDNCDIRSSVSTPYGCEKWWSDCPSKCQTANGNPECDVVSQSCPNGCASTNSCGKCISCKASSTSCDRFNATPECTAKCKAEGYIYRIWDYNSCGGHYQKYYVLPEHGCPYDANYSKFPGCGVCSDIRSDGCASSHPESIDLGRTPGRNDFDRWHWFGSHCSWAK